VRKPNFVRELLESNIVNIDDKNAKGETALLAASSYNIPLEIFEILLHSGADVNIRGTRELADEVVPGDTPRKSIFLAFLLAC
jgi:ankyrin repeat protein